MTLGNAAERLQLVVSLALSGRHDEAEAVAREIRDKAIAGEAWLALFRINANLQRLESAREALDRALETTPGSPALRLERALLLEAMGRAAESLAALEELAREDTDSPMLLVHLARALEFAGRDGEARAVLERGLARWPADPALHRQFALACWRAGEAGMQRLEQAIAAHPAELPLRLVAAELLRNAGDAARALTLLEGAARYAPGAPVIASAIGVVLDDLDRSAEALPYLRAAAKTAHNPAPVERNLAAVLLRTGEPAEALGIVDALLARTPDDQQLLAYRATALRLLGAAAYHALHDYARLVRAYRPAPPPGFPDVAAFNAAFADTLTRLHRGRQRPLAQSLRGGTQTDRNLPADEPHVAAFFAMIDAPIRDYIAQLGVPGHPTDRRRSPDYRIAGSWSVQLAPGGYHTDHVHPQGWISSAYYVELPAEDGSGSRAGWLRFGEPGLRIAGCAADHFVRPEPGMLVLFPSYLWHGTVPFHEGGRRLTAAFDVVPA